MTKKSDAEWRQELSDEAYHVLREKGTERAFCGIYWDHKEPGSYFCAACDAHLFDSNTKFDSGSGWPSFHSAVGNAIQEREDRGHGMVRTEVVCQNCDSHLGHVFPDGPPPTGLRYCINSVALKFKP